MDICPSLQKPQIEFIENFLRPEQVQRMLIYFSKQSPTDPHSSYGFTDTVVRLINDPLCIIFGPHGVYLFSNFLLVYPYSELDPQQVAYITGFLRTHVPDIPPSDSLDVTDKMVPSMKIDARCVKLMGGGFTVRPIQLTNIRLSLLDVLRALVRGIMIGGCKYSMTFRQHAVNLQLQRILTRIVISRAELHAINLEIERCVETQSTTNAKTHDSTAAVGMV